MSTPVRVRGGVLLAGLSALLLTLAFPPFGFWPLIWIGFIPAVVAQLRVMPRRWSGLAYGIAIGGFFWGYFGDMFAGSPWFLQWLPLLVGVVATLLSGRDRAFHERSGFRWLVVQGAVVWVGIEALRGFIASIGTGGFVAYALYSQPWLIQPVGIFSIYGMSLLILLVNYALALGALALFDRRWRLDPDGVAVAPELAGRWAAGIGVVAVGWVGLSLALLGQANRDQQIQVAAIQPGLVGATAAQPRLAALSRQAAAQGAQLIVWPEGALDFDPRTVAPGFRALAADAQAYLVIGYGFRLAQGIRNEATVLAPDGTFLGAYGKDHPVVWLGESSLTSGTYPTYPTPLGTLGTIICYDLDFTDTARKLAANGAQILAVPSNDWPALYTKQYTYLVFRAVENRVALVKADAGLDSAVIAPSGEIVALSVSSTAQSGIVQARVPLGRADAPLIVLGDWLGWVAVAGILFFAVLDLLTARQARRSHTPDLHPAPLPR